jgi:uncharacterized membrane protein YcaP (DUF421 family)
MIETLFGSPNHLTWWQECDRAILIFFFGLALVRVAGRRVFGKWGAIDIIVSIVIGSNLSRALTGGAELFGTLAATALVMAFHWLLSHAAARSPWLAKLVEGGMVELGKSGAVERSRMTAHAISQADLDEALRQQGVAHISDTRLITLEPSGKITILKAK